MRIEGIGILFTLIILKHFASGVILSTKQGVLQGAISTSRGGRQFYSFHGIPYAEPPVGQFRFENPVPAKPWKGIRDGTILPPLCLQYFLGQNIVGQEDCLYLNVYTSKISNETLLPVMVFTYGGRFMFGDALPDKYGPHYLMDKDVILITFHYRLGIFGFLSTEDEAIPGNYGLKDGVAVLRWVQKYIDDYGGDKNRVTVFGGSSGGVSASLTLISPLARGLFHRVISQSGQSFEIEKQGGARLNAWKIASLVGCDGDNATTSEQLRDCLKRIPANELVSHNWNLFILGDVLPGLPWSPVIENEKVAGAFLVDEPSKLLQRESDIPWILGMNSDDGGLMALTIHVRSYSASVMHELDTNYKKYFPSIFHYSDDGVNDTRQLDSITDVFKCRYFGRKNISADIRAFSNMFTALVYTRYIKEAVKLYRGPKYVYYYDHSNEESFLKVYLDTDLEMGVIHGEELVSLFNWSSSLSPITEGADLVVSEKMLDLWTNFATNGDPNYPNYKNEAVWKIAESPDDINYLHIKNGRFEMKNKFLKEELDFLENPLIDSCD